MFFSCDFAKILKTLDCSRAKHFFLLPVDRLFTLSRSKPVCNRNLYLNTKISTPTNGDGSVAEWSKALVLGTSHFDGVGSNPTAAKTVFLLPFFTSFFSCLLHLFLFYFILYSQISFGEFHYT